MCVSHNPVPLSRDTSDFVKKAVLRLLGDGCRHSISELSAIQVEPRILKEVVEYMVSEEELIIRDGMISR